METREGDDSRKVKKENKTKKTQSFPLHPSDGKNARETKMSKKN